jgi:hypothetical protein
LQARLKPLIRKTPPCSKRIAGGPRWATWRCQGVIEAANCLAYLLVVDIELKRR